jgi:Fe-S-cluster containining protein
MNNPQQLLHENIENFWKRFFEKYEQNMNCGKNCSSCCQVDLGVFISEAARISEWFDALTDKEKSDLRATWANVHEPTSKPNAAGKKQPACAFLIQSRCTVYEARPTICRTQGLPLMFREANPKTNETVLHVDVCPLNFTAENSLPHRDEWLDLDRLNALQSIATRQFSTSSAPNLEKLLDKQGRIPLKMLQKQLASSESSAFASQQSNGQND